MNGMRNPDTILAAWLDEGPTDLPDATRRAILTALPTTPQARRGVLARPRLVDMHGVGRLAAAALVAVVAISSALYVLAPRVGPGSTFAPIVQPSSSQSPSPGATVAMLTFTSPQYGYDVAIPATWNATPATEPWAGGDGIEQPDPPYADLFRLEGSAVGAAVRVKARAVSDGTTAAIWLAQWETIRAVGGLCFGSATPWTDTTVAGLPARRYEWRCDGSQTEDAKSNYDEYTFLAGGMGYVVSGTPSMVELVVQSFKAP